MRNRGAANWRLITFLCVCAIVVGAPAALFVREALNTGISERADGAVDVNLKRISTFTFDQRWGTLEDVPEEFRKLDGRRVVVQGEIVPGTSASRGELQKFELVYSISKCCMTTEPQIQHFVQAQVVPGKTVYNYNQPVTVVGTLKVSVTRDPETRKIIGVYHLDVESVEPSA